MNRGTIDEYASAYPVPFRGGQVPAVELLEPGRDYRESPALKHYLEILSRRKWVILMSITSILALMTAVTFLMPPTYMGQASVEVTPLMPKVTKFADVMNDSGELDEFTRTQVAVFQSDDLAMRVIDKLRLAENPAFNPFLDTGKTGLMVELKKTVKAVSEAVNRLVYGPLDPALIPFQQLEAMKQNFAQNLSVQAQPGTNIITVAFSSSDRQLARDVTNAVVQEFSSWQMDRRMDATKTAKAQLEKQIGEARKELEKSQAGMGTFAKQAGIVSLDSRSNLIYQQLEEINQALAKVEADRIARSEFYTQVKNGDPNSVSPVLQNSLIQQLKNQYIGLMAEYEKLLVIYKDDYPTVQNLKAKMLDLGRKLDVEQKRIVKSIETDLNASVKTEEALKAAATEKKVLALQLNDLAGQYKTLEDQVNTNRQIYQSLLGRSMEIDANVATDLGNIKIVNLASLPVMPYKPKILLNLSLALILGLVGGTGLALLLEHNDSTIKHTNEISDRFALPVLGVIPLAGKDEAKGLPSVVRTNPGSVVSEAIKFTKASIELSSRTESPTKSLLITSMSNGEGKSTVAANLAQAFAAGEETVLLIDADLRRGRLDETFAMNVKYQPNGLSRYLKGQCSLSVAIQKTDVPNLFLLPSGPHTHNSAQLLGSSKMEHLLEQVLPHFDRVILDGPPFGSDALVLGKQVDGLVLMATLGRTPRESLRVFRRTLQNVRANLLGVVINRLTLGRYSDEYYCQHYRSCSDHNGTQRKDSAVAPEAEIVN
jgi:polysaccharide biosynthesis transport protein